MVKCEGQGASTDTTGSMVTSMGGYGYGEGEVALLSPLLTGFGTCTSCSNGYQDGDESGIDCGGTACPKCSNGGKCNGDSDCISTKCDVEEHICRSFTRDELCSNEKEDDKTRETDTDCGGDCDPCPDKSVCKHDGDCMSDNCYGGVCVSCHNDIKDGVETDVNCGGTNFFLLVGNICGTRSGGACNVECSQCCSDLLSPADCNQCVSAAPSCTDHKSGGWDGCPSCKDGKICLTNRDCASNACEGGKCVSCSDGKKNGRESCSDGGGDVCRERCGNGEGCVVGSDCSSGMCYDNPAVSGEARVCVACDNQYRDGNETCVDGGGSSCSRRCKVDKGCLTGSDCATGYCKTDERDADGFGQCREAKVSEFCSNSALNADKGETCEDGGGPCSAFLGKRCDDGDSCLRDSDCFSSSCYNKICVSCNNGIQDGAETSVDCGGINLNGEAHFRSFPSSMMSGSFANQTAALVSADRDVSLSMYNGCPACPTLPYVSIWTLSLSPPQALTASVGTKVTQGIRVGQVLTAVSGTSVASIELFDTGVDTWTATDDIVIGSVTIGNTKISAAAAGTATAHKCARNEDCEGFCDTTTGGCVDCNDNLKSVFLGESDKDCGGEVCPKRCDDDKACTIDDDCASGSCYSNKCVSCTNGVKDSDESAIDCGGSHCSQRCSLTKACGVHSDCATGWCDAGTSQCAAMPAYVHCADNTQNSGESDVDCGWTCATRDKLCKSQVKSPAAAAQKCVENRDCADGLCFGLTGAKICTSCDNEIEDGLETDIDCGGGTSGRCTPCVDTKTCAVNDDCQSGRCGATSLKCESCFDGVQNGAETDM